MAGDFEIKTMQGCTVTNISSQYLVIQVPVPTYVADSVNQTFYREARSTAPFMIFKSTRNCIQKRRQEILIISVKISRNCWQCNTTVLVPTKIIPSDVLRNIPVDSSHQKPHTTQYKMTLSRAVISWAKDVLWTVFDNSTSSRFWSKGGSFDIILHSEPCHSSRLWWSHGATGNLLHSTVVFLLLLYILYAVWYQYRSGTTVLYMFNT